MKKGMTLFSVLLLAIVLGLIIGCTKDKGADPILEQDLRFANPDSVMSTLVYAYENQDIKLYERCLADSFKFEFPNIWGRVDSLWFKEDEIALTDSMFNYFEKIELELFLNDSLATYNSSAGRLYGAALYLLMKNRDGAYFAEGFQFFTFEKNMEDRWAISYWADVSAIPYGQYRKGVAKLSVEASHWGGIKALFLEQVKQARGY